MRFIKKHKVRLHKEITRESKGSRQRVDSVDSRLNIDHSATHHISRKNLYLSRRDDHSVRVSSRSNIFKTEIDGYRGLIVMQQRTKSRKEMLDKRLNRLN